MKLERFNLYQLKKLFAYTSTTIVLTQRSKRDDFFYLFNKFLIIIISEIVKQYQFNQSSINRFQLFRLIQYGSLFNQRCKIKSKLNLIIKILIKSVPLQIIYYFLESITIMQQIVSKAHPIIQELKRQRQSQKNLVLNKNTNAQKSNQDLCAIYLGKKDSTKRLTPRKSINKKQKGSTSRSKISQCSNIDKLLSKNLQTPKPSKNKIKAQFKQSQNGNITKNSKDQKRFKKSISNYQKSTKNFFMQQKQNLKKSQFYYANNNNFKSNIELENKHLKNDTNNILNNVQPPQQNIFYNTAYNSKIQTVPFTYAKLNNYSSDRLHMNHQQPIIDTYSNKNLNYDTSFGPSQQISYNIRKHQSINQKDHINLFYISQLEIQNAKHIQTIEKLKQNIKLKDGLLDECQKQIYHLKQTYEMMIKMIEISKTKQMQTMKEQLKMLKQQNKNNDQKQVQIKVVQKKQKTIKTQRKKYRQQKKYSKNSQKPQIQQPTMKQHYSKVKQQQQRQSLTYIKNVNTEQIEQNSVQQFRIQYSNQLNQHEQSIVQNSANSRAIQIQQSSFAITDSSLEEITEFLKLSNKDRKKDHNNKDKSKKTIHQHSQSNESINSQQKLILKTKNQITSTRKDIQVLKQRINSVMQKHNRIESLSKVGSQKPQKQTQNVSQNIKDNIIYKNSNFNSIGNDKQNVISFKKQIQTGFIVKNSLQPTSNSAFQSIITPVHRLRQFKSNHQNQ